MRAPRAVCIPWGCHLDVPLVPLLHRQSESLCVAVEAPSAFARPSASPSLQRGAPMARISSDAILSAADRWHIMKNLGDAVERSLARRHPALRAPAEAVLRAEQERLALLLAVAAVGAPPDPLLDAFPSAPLERA